MKLNSVKNFLKNFFIGIPFTIIILIFIGLLVKLPATILIISGVATMIWFINIIGEVAVLIYELVGPYLTKRALVRTGDIKKENLNK